MRCVKVMRKPYRRMFSGLFVARGVERRKPTSDELDLHRMKFEPNAVPGRPGRIFSNPDEYKVTRGSTMLFY